MKTKYLTAMFKTLCGIAFLSLAFYACKKKTVKEETDTVSMQTMSGGSNDFIFGPDSPTTGYQYTVLGRHYRQPLNVTNVKEAWNALSSNKILQLTPTHLYVKLIPQNLDQLKAIVDANIPVYTFPLDYEILRYGDYMRDPAQEQNALPPLFTCLPISKPIPISSYQVLDSIYMLDLRSVVAEKAFELAGESSVYPGAPEPGENIPEELTTVTNMLEDHINSNTSWYEIIPVPDYPPVPPPVSVGDPADNVSPPSTVAQACNCSLNSNSRKPSGCIKVEETQFFNGNTVFEGVNDVIADFIGPFFQRLSPRTNANGCFKSKFGIRYKAFGVTLPVLFTVIYASGKKTVKGVNHAGNPFEFAFPLTHTIGNVAPGALNNCNVTYLRDWDISHNETKWYASATTNNAIYDFDAYATQDDINTTFNNLQVLVHKAGGAGAAPMFAKMLLTGSPMALSISNYLAGVAGDLVALAPNPSVTYLSDLYIGYGHGNTPDRYATDRMKELVYHELAHSIHFKKCGNLMWEANIQYVINNVVFNHTPPYGTPAISGFGRCALLEMWAYYMGRNYAHRRYGPNRHSLSSFPSFLNSWYSENEWSSFDNQYIPSGFLFDLCDNNTYNTAHGLIGDLGITDNCRGYTPALIYSKMGPTTITATGLMNKLDNNLPTGTTQADYDALRQSYGY